MEKMLVRGVARDNDVARISICGIEDAPGRAFTVFSLISKKDIGVDVILQSIGRDGTKDISFTVALDDADEAVAIVERHREGSLKCQKVDVEKNIAKLSIVGAGMMSHPGVAAAMFECLYDEQVNIKMIATSEIRVTVIINDKDVERAINAVHDKFALGEGE